MKIVFLLVAVLMLPSCLGGTFYPKFVDFNGQEARIEWQGDFENHPDMRKRVKATSEHYVEYYSIDTKQERLALWLGLLTKNKIWDTPFTQAGFVRNMKQFSSLLDFDVSDFKPVVFTHNSYGRLMYGRMTVDGDDCFGFVNLVQKNVFDAGHRSRGKLWGGYCATPGEELTESKLQEVLGSYKFHWAPYDGIGLRFDPSS